MSLDVGVAARRKIPVRSDREFTGRVAPLRYLLSDGIVPNPAMPFRVTRSRTRESSEAQGCRWTSE